MKINKAKYQGYVWYSDQSSPQVILNQEFELELDERTNPFVVEGYLYSVEQSLSHVVKFVDGKYIHVTYDLSNLEGSDFVENAYYPVSDKAFGKRKLVFRQYWKEQSDDLCAGMKVRVPAENVFMGFREMEESL
jgi:CRISPR type III-associated protein (TIGR04423 family)